MRKRVSYANVTATLALVFAMSGGALAAKHYLISSTKQISPKVLKKLKGNTGNTGKEGAPGKEGAAGKEGAPGKEGKEGTPATVLWARVKFDGTLKAGRGVVSTKTLSTSGYEVLFNQNVQNCADEATVGSATVSSTNTEFDFENFGFAITEPRNKIPNAIYVETFNLKGEETKESFHLALFC